MELQEQQNSRTSKKNGIKTLLKLQKRQSEKTGSTNETNDEILTTQTTSNEIQSQLTQFHKVEVQIKVQSYAPKVFKYIRQADGIKDIDIIKSLDPKNNRYQIFKTNQGQKHNEGGKSGSFFFFTQDRQFIVKTINSEEKRKLIQMLP